MTIEFFGEVLLQTDKGFRELKCLQLKTFLMPKWHIWGQHVLIPSASKSVSWGKKIQSIGHFWRRKMDLYRIIVLTFFILRRFYIILSVTLRLSLMPTVISRSLSPPLRTYYDSGTKTVPPQCFAEISFIFMIRAKHAMSRNTDLFTAHPTLVLPEYQCFRLSFILTPQFSMPLIVG